VRRPSSGSTQPIGAKKECAEYQTKDLAKVNDTYTKLVMNMGKDERGEKLIPIPASGIINMVRLLITSHTAEESTLEHLESEQILAIALLPRVTRQ